MVEEIHPGAQVGSVKHVATITRRSKLSDYLKRLGVWAAVYIFPLFNGASWAILTWGILSTTAMPLLGYLPITVVIFSAVVLGLVYSLIANAVVMKLLKKIWTANWQDFINSFRRKSGVHQLKIGFTYGSLLAVSMLGGYALYCELLENYLLIGHMPVVLMTLGCLVGVFVWSSVLLMLGHKAIQTIDKKSEKLLTQDPVFKKNKVLQIIYQISMLLLPVSMIYLLLDFTALHFPMWALGIGIGIAVLSAGVLAIPAMIRLKSEVQEDWECSKSCPLYERVWSIVKLFAWELYYVIKLFLLAAHAAFEASVAGAGAGQGDSPIAKLFEAFLGMGANISHKFSSVFVTAVSDAAETAADGGATLMSGTTKMYRMSVTLDGQPDLGFCVRINDIKGKIKICASDSGAQIEQGVIYLHLSFGRAAVEASSKSVSADSVVVQPAYNECLEWYNKVQAEVGKVEQLSAEKTNNPSIWMKVLRVALISIAIYSATIQGLNGGIEFIKIFHAHPIFLVLAVIASLAIEVKFFHNFVSGERLERLRQPYQYLESCVPAHTLSKELYRQYEVGRAATTISKRAREMQARSHQRVKASAMPTVSA